jgi:PEP-CTERM motif-containing protein
MLVCLARHALRLSGLSVALAMLAWLAPAPAQADVCSPFLSGIGGFPGAGVPNGTSTNGGCTTVLTINPNGTVSVTHNNTPYTNSGNSLIGVVNNSSNSVFDLFITGFNNSSPGILQFNSPAQAANAAELLCATSLTPKLSCGGAGTTGDEGITSAGQFVFFNAIGPANGAPGNTGDVIFTGDLLPGQTAIFGTLADILNSSISPVPVPEPGSFAVLATGLLGLAFYRLRLRRRRATLQPKPQRA